jgi:DNA mismatch endonuclease, patch repair protein
MDVFTKAKRSDVMSRIRSYGNRSTELRLMKVFRSHRIIGWRRRQRLQGNPDFTFRKQRVCVFVDGCFWHGCPRCYRRPTSNLTYWEQKVERNRSRDRKVNRELHKAGWRVLRIREHELRSKQDALVVTRILRHLKGSVRDKDNRKIVG